MPAEEAAGEEAAGEEAGERASATSTVIRGDLPQAAGLADVWLDLHLALEIIASPAEGRTVKRARRVRPGSIADDRGSQAPRKPEAGRAGRAARRQFMKYPGMSGAPAPDIPGSPTARDPRARHAAWARSSGRGTPQPAECRSLGLAWVGHHNAGVRLVREGH